MIPYKFKGAATPANLMLAQYSVPTHNQWYTGTVQSAYKVLA